MFAPFRFGLVVCPSSYIIAGKSVFRKCAILGSLGFFQRTNRDADFPQRHFGYVADSVSKDGGNVRRIKVQDVTEIEIVLIDGGIIAAARQQHIGDTAPHGAPEFHLDVELVQILQQTALCIQRQIPEIVRNVVLHQHLCRLFQKLWKGLHLLPRNPEAVGQGLHHGKLVPELHLPNGHGSPGIAVRVGNVEHIAQAVTGRGGIQQGDAVGTFVDPAAKLVPELYARTSGGVGLLLVD